MRIVSLLPSATEILFGIGAGGDVVGVTHECDFPAEVRTRPKLTAAAGPQMQTPGGIDRHVRAAVHAGSSLYHLDAELLDRLAPDLIVTQELCPVCAVSYEIVTAAAKRLRSDPRVVSLEPRSLDDVFANIELLGGITGRAEGASQLIAGLTSRVEALQRCKGLRATPRTLVLEWTDPPMSAGHWIPGLIELAGGTPILAHPGSNSQRLGWDEIAAAEPDAIVIAPCGMDLAATQRALALLDSLAQWRALRARNRGRVLPMDGNAYMSRPGPRLVDSAEIVARWYTTVAEYAG
jgi:iron complex transport system substrate-binding protein